KVSIAMILARFFRPKWQHSNPQVRSQAVAQLSPQDPETKAILRRLAVDDPEVEVRKAAIKQVADLEFLRRCIDEEQNAGVREVAAARYRQVLAGGPEAPELASRLAELGTCSDEVVLGHIARRAHEPELRLAALERLQSVPVLEEIAIYDAALKVRQAAVLRLTEAASLERVIRHTKEHDRRVARLAREALERLRQEQQANAQAHSKRLLICESLERLAASDRPDSAERQRLENRWNAVAIAAEPQLEQRFRTLLAQCLARAAAPPAAVIEHAEQTSVAPPAFDAAALEALVSTLRQEPQPDPARLELVRDLLAAAAEAGQDRTHYPALALLQNYLAAATRYLAQENRLEAALKILRADAAGEERAFQRASQRLGELIDTVHWQLELPAPPLLAEGTVALAAAARRREQMAVRRQQLRDELEQLLPALETSLSEGRLKESQRLLAQAQKLSEQLPPSDRSRFDRRLKHDAGRVRELQDWRRFATLPKQLELCEQMEALIEADLPPPELAERIQRLQEQWKATGGSSSPEGQRLWERFQAAGKQAFDRCRGYFDEQAQRRQENLQRRQDIASQLEQFIAAADWPQLELAALESIRSQARAEWQAAVPVDRRAGRAIEAQFEALMDALTGHIRAKQQTNRQRKEALIAQAKQLIAADDPRAAAEQAKSLQAEWKAIGHAQPNIDRRLWREFRSACDEIFAHRDAVRSEADQEREARVARARELCNEAESLAADAAAAPADVEAKLAALREEYDGLRPLPREQAAAFSRQLREAERALADRRRRQAQEREQQALAVGRARAQLCAELEQAALAGTAGAAAAWQARWEILDQAPADLQARLEARWRRALAATEGGQAFTEQELAANLEARWDLCLWMEILAGLESPPEERARRMDLQVRRLADGMTAGRQLSVGAQIRAVEIEWLAAGPAVATPQAEALAGRFDAAQAKAAARAESGA
ncbi:MAG TPA: DUF349 domain-containing protein, partial [Gammaproteobacteria bacterium]|nr:DUF349 domain-containing protein [Gammaproteobacteria bacterium]